MIIFGFLNGLILQPIILSYFGPINENNEQEKEWDKNSDINEKKESIPANKVITTSSINLEISQTKEPSKGVRVVTKANSPPSEERKKEDLTLTH